MGNKKTAVLDIQSDTITLVMQDKKFSDSFSFHDSRSYSGFQNGEFLNKDELIGAVRSLIDRCRKTTFSDPEEIMVGVPAEFTLATVAEKEVDFIVKDANDGLIYIQVAVTVMDEAKLEQELRPFREIEDNYPKYIITLDDMFVKDHDGIKTVNALDFLLGQPL